MNILYVIHTPRDSRTAVFKTARQARQYAHARGHRMTILAPEHFRCFRSISRWLPLFYPAAVALHLMRRSQKYDLVIFHSYSGYAFHFVRFFRRFRFRTITVFHGLEPLYFRELARQARLEGKSLSLRFRLFYPGFLLPLLKFSCRRSDMVFCLNQEEKSCLIRENYQRGEKIRVTANGVSGIFFAANRERKQARTLLFVGQAQPLKGIQYLREAFICLAAEYPGIELVLAGVLRGRETILEMFPEELRGRIEVIPSIRAEAMPDIYAHADIFIFPSLMEGFSLALIEAMASGLAIVASRTGAAPELIENGRQGILVEKRNTQQLVDAVKFLIENPQEMARSAAAARETARHYETGRIMGEWLDVCESVAGKQPGVRV